MPNGDAPNGSRRTTAKYLALVVVTVVLALLFLLLLHSLALPLVFAGIVAVLAHPLQEKLVRGMGGLDWLAAAGLTIAFVSIVAIPPILAVGVAYEDLHGLLKEVGPANPDGNQLSENSPQLRPAIVSQVDTVVRVWVLKGIVRMHPLVVFVSILGGIQVLGILGLVVGPVTAAVLFALLRVLLRESTDPSVSKVPEPTTPA